MSDRHLSPDTRFPKAIIKTVWCCNCQILFPRYPDLSRLKNSGNNHGSVIKSSGMKPGLKFPIIDNTSVKQKLKHNISLKKVKKSVLDPNEATSDLGIPQDCARRLSEFAFKSKKKSQRRSITLFPKLSLDCKGLEREELPAIPPQTHAQSLTCQETGCSFTASKSKSSSLLHHKIVPFRTTGRNCCSIQHSTMEDSSEEMEDAEDTNWLKKRFSQSISKIASSLRQSIKFNQLHLSQSEQSNLEQGGKDKNASSRQHKSSHWLLREHSTVVTDGEPCRRESKDSDRLYPPAGSCIEHTGLSEFEHRPSNSSFQNMLSNANSGDMASVHTFRFLYKEKCHGGFLRSVLSAARRPAPNSPGSSSQAARKSSTSTNWSSPTAFPQTSDSDHRSTSSKHMFLSPTRYRNLLSTSESFDISDNDFEDSSFLEDIIDHRQNTSSSSGTPNFRESLRSSFRSSSLHPSSSSLFQRRFSPDHCIASVLQCQFPFASLALPSLQNPCSTRNTTASGSTRTKEAKRMQANQEKLRQHRSLLTEHSVEEDQCCICQAGGSSPTNPLLTLCGCVGSLQFVHQECLKQWLTTKIKSGLNLRAVKTCELCRQNLIIDMDDFNVNTYYRNHQKSGDILSVKLAALHFCRLRLKDLIIPLVPTLTPHSRLSAVSTARKNK